MHESGFHLSCLQDKHRFFLEGLLTYTLKRKQLRRKREEICKTVASDNVENEQILHLNVKSIDFQFEDLETLIETLGVNRPTLVYR